MCSPFFYLPIAPVSQACVELPAILLALGGPECDASAARPDALARLFCDLDFVAAAAHDGRVGELLAGMAAAEAQLVELSPGTGPPELARLAADVSSMRRWARQAAVLLVDGRAFMAYVDALSSPPGCAADRAVRSLVASGLDLSGCWVRIEGDRPAAFSPCLAVLEGHTGRVASVAFSPDGLKVASGAGDKAVRVWSTLNGETLTVLKHASEVESVAFSPCGRQLASAARDNAARVWAVDSGEPLKTLEAHTDRVNSVAWSPDGLTIATVSSDKTVILWSAITGEQVMTLQGHTDGVACVHFSLDGRRIASGSSDRTARVWSVDTGQAVALLVGHAYEVQSVALSPPAGRLLASGSGDKTVRIWTVSSGRVLFTLRGHTDPVSSVAWSPDGRVVASGSGDKTVRLWSVEKGEVTAVLEGHSVWVNAIAYSCDGSMIASGSGDATIRLWSADTGAVILQEGHSAAINSVAVSSDGRTIASASMDGTARLWLAATGTAVSTLVGHSREVNSISFSPDGRVVASVSYDKTVRLWKASGEAIATLSGHTAFIWNVTFSPDSRMIATGDQGRVTRVWSTSSGKCRRVIVGTHDAASVFRADAAPAPVPAAAPSFRPLACTWSAKDRWVRVELPRSLIGTGGVVAPLPVGGTVDGTALSAGGAASVLYFPPGKLPRHASAALVGEEGGREPPAARLFVLFQAGTVMRFRAHVQMAIS